MAATKGGNFSTSLHEATIVTNRSRGQPLRLHGYGNGLGSQNPLSRWLELRLHAVDGIDQGLLVNANKTGM